MEKKTISLRIFILHSVIRFCYGKQNRLRFVEKKWYSGKPYTVTSGCEKFQMKLHYKPCDEISSVQAECLDE